MKLKVFYFLENNSFRHESYVYYKLLDPPYWKGYENPSSI